jgi:hypothetical protein
MRGSCGLTGISSMRGSRPHRSATKPFDLARLRLREIERIMRFRKCRGADVEIFLLPAARALRSIHRNTTAPLDSRELLERLSFWAAGFGADAAMLRAAVEEAVGHPRMEKADLLAQRLAQTYHDRQLLGIRTIGACDADNKERKRRARERKRVKDRHWRAEHRRKAAERKGRTVRPRAEWLACSASRLQPWTGEGVSRRTWYRRKAERSGTGAR